MGTQIGHPLHQCLVSFVCLLVGFLQIVHLALEVLDLFFELLVGNPEFLRSAATCDKCARETTRVIYAGLRAQRILVLSGNAVPHALEFVLQVGGP